ncbi:hypothetical protein GCM10010919_22830 [Alishewanella longhuensis]|uniref:Uncharacterized protein n=1 Tax=Alishewanella longhuensis TaxID=1091037 RepID=A0ABQ3KZ00_9ALTE|nr:EAL domain-containing protein [Alishewanella longhuensis]GHG71492.1 hypothetical protein GCM10010919_22830 [Alishewanella longhuensis]
MSDTWKIQDSISRSAALAFYLLVAGFFIIVALLGIAEQIFLSKLMLPILSLTLVLICALISIGFSAVVFQWHKLRWASGLLLFVLAVKLSITGVANQHELSGIPLSVLVGLLTMAAAALLLPLSSKASRYLWQILAAIVFGYGVFLQLCLWLPILPTSAQTPFSSSLIPVMLLMGGLALGLRQHFSLTANGALTRSTFIAIVMFQAGYGVWFALTLYDIRYETHIAEQKTQRVVNQVETQLQFSESLFSRANARWQRVELHQRLAFMAADLTDLTNAYNLIHGAIVYDTAFKPALTTGNAELFYQQGLLNSPALLNWLKQPDSEFNIATNGASLNTSQPFLMLKLYVPLPESSAQVVLILINLQQALITEDAHNGAQLKIYLEALPDVLLSADAHSYYRATLAELIQRYRYHFKVLPNAQQWNGRSFYVFVSDISSLQARSRLHQVVLWVALVFCCTFVLAADRTRQLRREKAKLVSLAKFDDITGLLRRDAFYQATEVAVPLADALPEAMIFIDLDGFKPINDSFGHDVGDKLLTEIASRIRVLVGEQTLLARFSGDEFLVYLPACHATDAERLAQQLLKSIAGPSSTTGFNVYLTASIGIVINTQAGKSSQLLTQLADVAMSYAKQAGGNTFRFYQQAMAEDYRSIMAIRNRLQAALDVKQLQVFYQPIIDFISGRVVAIESLVRWHDQGRFVSPAEFIPIAEQTGQIIQLGEQVTEIVLRDLAEQPQLAGLSAAINVSSQQLRRYDYVSFLEQALARFAIAPQRICVELTESALLEGQSNAFLLPERIKQLGCLLALDDFGTGYSSLSYLYRLPADSIKLDRSFTQDLQNDEKQRKIVEMMVSTCKQIGKTVVIEGVETPEMAKLCQELGCDRVQGYYYARPMALADLLIYLSEQPV